MKKAFSPFVPLLFLLLFAACTPKTTEQIATTTPIPAPPPPPKKEGPCRTFQDAPSPDEALRNFVLYRDFLKVEDWDQAFSLWQKVYAEAPAADGQRNTVFADGIRFYERFITQATDSVQKEKFIDQVFKLYEDIGTCYAEGGYVPARKAFDLYYAYPHRASRKEIYTLFKQAIDIDGLKTPDFVLNPFSALLVELYFDNQVSLEEAKKYQQLLRDILANGLKTCADKACERWKIVESYAPTRLEAFETVKGFYDCDYYMDKYYADYLNAPTDCDVMREVYSRLKWAGCPETEEKFAQLIATGNKVCAPEKGPAELAYNCLRDADYTCAIEGFEKAAAEIEDPIKKGQYLLLISKIYNANLKNFSLSRKYAQRAAAARPNWGEPYIQIGRLYASSGPICGPGRGWDSQIVVWAAIDMWNKAKAVDPSAAAEANRWINRYAQYMPNREDVFLRNLKSGDRFYIGCWIQEYTTIRTVD